MDFTSYKPSNLYGDSNLIAKGDSSTTIPKFTLDINKLTKNAVCMRCPNNPRNGGSGICNCILGSPKIT